MHCQLCGKSVDRKYYNGKWHIIDPEEITIISEKKKEIFKGFRLHIETCPIQLDKNHKEAIREFRKIREMING